MRQRGGTPKRHPLLCCPAAPQTPSFRDSRRYPFGSCSDEIANGANHNTLAPLASSCLAELVGTYPKEMPLTEVRALRDDIAARLEALLDTL